MKSRVIHTKIWNDSWFRSLQLSEKLYFLYLLTNEFTNVLDIYELPPSVVQYQIQLSPEDVKPIKAKFKQDKKIDFYKDYVFITNAYKYQFYKGVKNNYAKLRIIYEMSDDVISYFDNPIHITLSAIIQESKEHAVKDENFISLLQRVINRLSTLNITLSEYQYTDTHKNTEYKIQKLEIQNTEKKETAFASEYRDLIRSKGISV